MKRMYALLFSIEFLILTNAVGAVAEIKLDGSKNRVLSSKQRTLVLEAADRYLNRSDENFIASLGNIQSPYPSKPDIAAEEESQTPLVYDTASILEVIGANFAQQVRGTLAKGGTHYLQLQGGGLLEAGSSFPAEIPQIKNQSFTVSVLNVNPRGYTLKVEDSILEVLFETTSGVTRD